MEKVISEHIEKTPGVCGGRPRIAGHRIRVSDIVIWHEKLGRTPDEIVAEHPQIGLADVYAALTYYHDHESEIRQEIRADHRFAKTLEEKTPSVLAERMREIRKSETSLSSGRKRRSKRS